MRALVFGSGRIGCGFAGQLLSVSGHEVVFASRNPSVVDHLNRLESYRVRLVWGRQVQDHMVHGVRAVCTANTASVAQEIARADLIVTAVGAGNLPDVARLIAAGLAGRDSAVNVLAFENMSNAGAHLGAMVASRLPRRGGLLRHGFASVVVHRAVTVRRGDPAGDDRLTFIGEPLDQFVVDAPRLVEPLPPIRGMISTQSYLDWMRKKLYVYSAGHATCAYLGHLKGYRYVHSAIRDPEIRAAVLAAMDEGKRGLAARYGCEVGEVELAKHLSRFENAALNDPIQRVGRDPGRKLRGEERLVGAALLAELAGIRPEKLTLATAAAFCFFSPADPSSRALREEINAGGLASTLRRLSGLDPLHGVGSAVVSDWDRLSVGGRVGTPLLSLARMLWAEASAGSTQVARK